MTRPLQKPAGETAPVRAEARGGVLRLTLDRPGERNALSRAMMAALHARLNEAAEARDVKVLVIAAEPPAFCAGHDLKEIAAAREADDAGRATFETLMAQCASLMQAVARHPKPVIAQVDGIATAAGCQLVASCDLAIASQSARFCTPGVDIGLFCSTPMVALSRNVAPKHAMEMLLTGEPVDAGTAWRFGLVNRVVPAESLDEETRALAEAIAAKPAAVVRMGKRAFHEQAGMDLSAAYDHAARVMVDNLLHRDAEEGIGAFAAKRQPRWSE